MHWNASAREALWASLSSTRWDLIVIGGGITGAAVLREAARAGLTGLLVEQHDFAWGTSSRSTKMVHGGLRYLDELEFSIVRQSIRERERLLDEGDGLVVPLPYLFALTRTESRRKMVMLRAGVGLYDAFNGVWPRGPLSADEVLGRLPALSLEHLQRGLCYDEGWVDDARLVLRVLREATANGGSRALNFVRVERLLRDDTGAVTGVALVDVEGERTATLHARAVVNATGVWADQLRAGVGGSPRLRPLRGSHLLFSRARLPLDGGVSFRHPVDRRFVCALPWEDATLVGTTDHDHRDDLSLEPRISSAEQAYLLEAAATAFPASKLTAADILSTFAGVRAVVKAGEGDPSQASREHLVSSEAGLVTITGGKLTTCRAMARDALHALKDRLPALGALTPADRFLDPLPQVTASTLSAAATLRLLGRYGSDASEVLAMAAHELTPVGNTSTSWAELRFAARAEAVHHLDDLLLRRTRLGLLLEQGAAGVLSGVRAVCEEELGWDDARWRVEVERYQALWRECYGPARESGSGSPARP